jgi:hypothetical protein
MTKTTKPALVFAFALLAAAACGKDDKAGGGGGGGGGALTGACHNEAAGDCWEHPAGGDPAVLGDICDNDPGAKWIASCPRDKLVGGCKSSNKFDKRAPTHFFYKGTADEVKARCTSAGELFVEK